MQRQCINLRKKCECLSIKLYMDPKYVATYIKLNITSYIKPTE